MNKSGFTLVEILVVLAIFATTTVVASGIFVTNTRAQRKVAEVQRAQGDGHGGGRFRRDAQNRHQDPEKTRGLPRENLAL